MRSTGRWPAFPYTEFHLLFTRASFPLCEQRQVIEAFRSEIRILESHYQTLTAANPPLSRLLEYLERHYTEKMTSQDVCRYMCMSASTLNRFLKEQTGKTFVDLLHTVRIRHAEELLRASSDCLAGVGYSVGFETERHFFLTFKKVTGMTPGEWRRTAKGERV